MIYLNDSLDLESSKIHNITRFGGTPSRTFLGIPLALRNEVIGILSVQSYEPNAYNFEQINLLETIAVQAAIAIENARLYEEAHRRIEEMSSLYDIGMAVTSKLDRDEVLQNLFENLCIRIINCNIKSIHWEKFFAFLE